MTFSKIGRLLTALLATAMLGLGMTACGGGTIGYLYVPGSYYNQISGFKIDDYTGNLTAIEHGPFTSGGTDPAYLVIKTGGRYVYVINSGTAPVGTPGAAGYVAPTGSGISVFSVGGDGVLTFQQTYPSQGIYPIWATFDSSSNYLYVLDKFAPDYNPLAPSGDITAFSVASDTGRLTLVQNTTVLSGNLPTNFFRVGPNPIMTKVASGSCLYTLSANSVYADVIGSGGQLNVATTGSYNVSGSSSLSSINTTGNVYITDKGGNQIFSLTSGTGCSLAPISGSQQTNVPGTANPVNSLTSSNGRYLYVLNQSSTGSTVTTAQSTISAFTIETGTGKLATLADTGNNPYAVGSGPVCAVQDPTGQYIYVANNADGTVTGKLLNQQYGYLSNLTRGSVFNATMNPTCVAVSGNI
jgi:6-phosphogluconolactonase